MHFYQFNIGDYAKKTQHLTNEEDLAYRRLLDMYYDTENPVLTSGLATLSRRLRVSEKALENVLAEFFPDGKNKCADEKIAEYYEYLEKQKLNGRKGGRPKNNPPLTDGNPSLTQPEPITSKPLTKGKPKTIAPEAALDLPNCIPFDAWQRWIKYRHEIKKPLSPSTVNAQIAKLCTMHKRGHDPTAIIDESIANSWSGLFEPKINGSNHGNSRFDKLAATAAALTGGSQRTFDSATGRMD